MAITENRKYSKAFVFNLLEGIKGKTLGEIDKSNQFARAATNKKITGIAGDVIEQSVFGYARDSNQECDIEIDGIQTELKTTGLTIPLAKRKNLKDKSKEEYNLHLQAKEPMSITGVTFEPAVQTDFETSHFWEKSERLLIIFYEYLENSAVSASEYSKFPIVDYCYNTFSESEKATLQSDWEKVRDFLLNIYSKYPDKEDRNLNLIGFTSVIKPSLMYIDLAPSFKKRASGSYQKPRYRLKRTFLNHIVKGHFDKSRHHQEISLKESFTSFEQLDAKCHELTLKFGGKTLAQLKELLQIDTEIGTKDFTSKCILKMFDADCGRLNQISDFTKAGIIAKTITITPSGNRTEDMKLDHIDFDEWADRNIDFEDSEIYNFFSEHSFLCPIFCERGDTKKRVVPEDMQHTEDKRIIEETGKTTFEGFKRFAFDEDFIMSQARKTWSDSRNLIHQNKLEWEYVVDQNGNRLQNKSGSFRGAPNFPKSRDYDVFFRGGANTSRDSDKTESVNGIQMLPQFYWLKGSFIADKLKSLPYL